MRKGWMAPAVMLAALLAVTGCLDKRTGDVGQKNIRPYYANDYEKNRLPINGTHSYGANTFRTRFANDESQERNRMMGRNRLGNNIVGPHENYRLEMNDRVAQHVAAMPEVHAAYVMLTDHSAYVAVTVPRKAGKTARVADIEGGLKTKIADRVRAMSPAVRNVYVTSNPEFVDRLRTYSDAVRSGQSAQDFLAPFNALVHRVFPASTAVTR